MRTAVDCMSRKGKGSAEGKISEEFSARLAQLGPRQRVRAIVMLDIKPQGKGAKRRMSRQERKAAIEGARSSADAATGYSCHRRLRKRGDGLAGS